MKKKSILFFLTAAFLFLLRPLFSETFQHAMQLQLADVNGAPVENTQFWITVQIVKKKDQVTLNFPTINFQAGQCASNDPDCTGTQPGYIITASGYLPPELRPNVLIPISVNAPSGDGLAQTATHAEMSPIPPSGFIVMVDNSGGVLIQQAGSGSNTIAAGPHAVLPFSVKYQAGKRENICFNFQLSQGQIDVTQFTNAHTTFDNIRDSHINDASNGTFAWAWTDNHNVDPQANILNVFVLVGKIDKKGRMKLGKPIQLTNFPPNTYAWDTSVAINRQDKNNIVVSYGLVDETGSANCRAVTFDGGKTWGGVFDGVNSSAQNGLINYQPTMGFGDIPGVGADQFGNFWFGATDKANSFRPYLLASTDKGLTWNTVYNFPSAGSMAFYDYPHFVFGGNGSGQYGVWYYTDFFDSAGNIFPGVAFIPINGLGNFGSSTTTFLTSLENGIAVPTVAVSNDGRFWGLGVSPIVTFLYNWPFVTIFKSSGPIDQNYAGPWLAGSENQLNDISPNVYHFDSVPDKGYFLSVQGLIYDDKRQALYALFAAPNPPLSQSMRLYFSISRNNGQTWSSPYDISATAFANRGFDTMSLDPSSGNIYIGWYDGRNDPSQTKIQYFGGIIPAQLLDQLVKQIPLSNPQYQIPGQGSPPPPPP